MLNQYAQNSFAIMLESNLPHMVEALHGLGSLVRIKSKEKLFKRFTFRSKATRQQFAIRLHYFLNSSYLHGVRFMDQQYGAGDR